MYNFTYHKADLVIAWGGSYEPPKPPLVTGLLKHIKLLAYDHSLEPDESVYCTTKAAITVTIAIRLRFDSSQKVGIMTVGHLNEGTNSYRTTFYFGSR